MLYLAFCFHRPLFTSLSFLPAVTNPCHQNVAGEVDQKRLWGKEQFRNTGCCKWKQNLPEEPTFELPIIHKGLCLGIWLVELRGRWQRNLQWKLVCTPQIVQLLTVGRRTWQSFKSCDQIYLSSDGTHPEVGVELSSAPTATELPAMASLAPWGLRTAVLLLPGSQQRYLLPAEDLKSSNTWNQCCFLYDFPIVTIIEREWASTPGQKNAAKSKPGRFALLENFWQTVKYITRNCAFFMLASKRSITVLIIEVRGDHKRAVKEEKLWVWSIIPVDSGWFLLVIS